MRLIFALPFAAIALMTSGIISGLKAPEVSHVPFGVTAGGEAVERYTLRNRHGTEVSVLTYGAILDAVRVRDRRGRFDNVVLDLADLKAHEARANFSAVVGRFANRISGGGFVLDGQRVVLDPRGGTVAHGGRPGFSGHVWTAQPCQPLGCRSVTLSYVSPDGENGFPGTMLVSVTYSLSDDDTLTLDYRATTDKATVINLTNHAYFNLAGATSGSTDGQYLQLRADAITTLSDKKLPTGAFRRVDGTPFDFRKPALIGEQIVKADPQLKIGGGFDHNFVLTKPAQAALSVAARAWDPLSGRTLELKTTEPGLQLFTGNGFNGMLKGRAGNRIWPRDGYALETQHFPDSPNRPEFPSTVLRPGEAFHSVTSIRFGTAKTLKEAFPN
ncbi:aldose epimerase family protein [Asticcacaulis sp. AND118]|uniref:aldose epimerase family protein n=1 Tax=Asticcacaulis sp. AND118 TaxID=2840468 RepID=UPI001D00119E|nr:aldose epimerase family protein [Asticcacaulis sp. AND118]UDF04892.1 galactose mutarotase [Asticcacaulis sp. AND118]